MQLVLEVKGCKTEGIFKTIGGGTLAVTPPIDEGFWRYRVKVSDSQAVVGFPKFFTIGIGFQHEDDWNTNLPWTCNAKEIYNHIEHNRAGADPELCVKAIEMIQEQIRSENTDAQPI